MTLFDQLPTEILRRIGSFSTAETALSLMLCNKTLNIAIHDSFVFRAIILNLNRHSSVTEKYWDISFLPTTTSVSTLIQYAIADSKARSWRYLPRLKRNETPYTCTEAHFRWAPHLAALGHPFVQDLDVTVYITELEALHMTRPQLRAQKYMLHGSLLSHFQHVDNFSASTLTPLDMSDTPDHDFTTPDHLNLVISLARWQAQTRLRDSVRLPPSIDRIPFAKIVIDPITPFTPGLNFDSRFLKCLTTREFIEDGEWLGYYSFNTTLRHQPGFDPPMERIRFRVTDSATSIITLEDGSEPIPGQVSAWHVSSTGVDNVGDFHLEGQIHADGRVMLSKRYDQGFGWGWEAKMTPFGIMGFWGPEEGARYGYVWLWKKEWSA